MEVIVNPAMIFLDEPTSGLDTYTAYQVISILSHLARQQNRTVIATIHQPSSDIYNLFDDLMILANGRVMYYGTATHAIEYFREKGYPCPQYSNPADHFFMHILNDFEGTEENDATNRIQTLLDQWVQSEEYQNMLGRIENRDRSGVTFESLRTRAPYYRQFLFLLDRASKNAIRNKLVVQVKLFQSIFVGLLLGLVYVNINSKPVAQQIQVFLSITNSIDRIRRVYCSLLR